MKKLSFIVFLIFSLVTGVSAQENIFVLKDSYIYPKKKFIDSLAVTDATVKPYEVVAKTTATINKGRDTRYQVVLSKFAGGNYPGDFQVIQVLLGNKCLCEVTNADGWALLPANIPASNAYYFDVHISPYSTALFFFSQPKDNYPQDLTIVVIKTGKAHLVYNRPCVLQSISKNSYSIKLEMDDRYPVYFAPAGTTSEVVTSEVVEEKSQETQVETPQPIEMPKKRKKLRRRAKQETIAEVVQPQSVDTVKVEPTPVVVKEEPKEPEFPKRYLLWSENGLLKIKEQQ